MRISQLIFRNLKKNIQHYYLYVFALMFSVALYFAFVSLQYDPAVLNETKGSISGAAGVRTGSILLVVIVCVFTLYANNLFIRRRGKEVGLFQLVGMTKGKIFRILIAENVMLYLSALALGIFAGFSVSKLIAMIFLNITGIETGATLHFSSEALIQTLLVFGVIYLLVMGMNFAFIRRQSILSLFNVSSTTEDKVKKVSLFEITIGVLGLVMIGSGYYVSSKLFSGDLTEMTELLLAMVFILASVIMGTYLFYKGSVRLISYLLRKRKDGYLNVDQVLSLSAIMFRMKSNALLLTVVTTVSALAIGLLSLSYISYYSAEQTAQNYVPNHFAFTHETDADMFKENLQEKDLAYTETMIDVIQVQVDLSQIMDIDSEGSNVDPSEVSMAVISDLHAEGIDLTEETAVFSGLDDALRQFMSFKESGPIAIHGQNKVIPLEYTGMNENYFVSLYFTNGGFPVAIVDHAVFAQLQDDLNPDIQKASSTYIGIDLSDEDDIEEANDILQRMTFEDGYDPLSQLEMMTYQKANMGLVMFIVGFLGLTFLVTSGCILYFKQMDESEDEQPSYTILRKLGFTPDELLKGIKRKQVFNFGIPLVVGLLHSYFAVRSGWFLFGTELWTPMIVVMTLYTALYSIFGILSVLYYKRVISDAL